MKTLKFIAALFLVALVCANTMAQKSEVRKVSHFSAIDVSEGIHVELTLGDKEFVEVTADDDIINRVITEVSDGNLEIYIKGNNWNGWKKKVNVKVIANKIDGLDASSGASIYSTNTITTDILNMSVSSGANLKVKFDANKAACDASSGADAILSGKANMFKTEASSGSDIHADNVIAQRVKADVSSGAGISVHAEQELIAEASSGGSVRYSGNPKMVDVDKSSGGSVNKK